MDYEKKYKETLEKAKVFLKRWECVEEANSSLVMEEVKDIFPELKVSEDERIRKALIELVKYAKRGCFEILKGMPFNVVSMDAMLAWLEKQGDEKPTLPKWKYKKDNMPLLRDSIILNKYGGVAKSPSGAIISDAWVLDYDELAKLPKEEVEKQDEQNPTNKIEPKFKVGDWCIDNEDATIFQIVKVLDNTYTYKTNEGSVYSCTHYSLENDARLWTIKDAKDRDILTVNGRPFIYCCNGVYQGNYCCIDSEGVFRTNLDFGFNGKTILPATKEQRDLILQMSKNTPLNY